MTPSLRAFSRSLPMSLLRSREAVMERFRPLLRRHRITEQQWRVLRALSSVDDVSATTLARLTLISTPSLSRILRSLERRKLIARRTKATDLRTTLVGLSDKGASLLAKVGPESEARYDDIGRVFGRHRLQELYDLLDALTDVLARVETGPAGSRAHSHAARLAGQRPGPRDPRADRRSR